MRSNVLGFIVVATLTLPGAFRAQSVRIERHDSMRGDWVLRVERIDRTDRLRPV